MWDQLSDKVLLYNLGPFKIIEVSNYCKFNIYMYIKYAVEMALHGTGSDSLELANSCAGNCTRSRMEQNIDPHAFWLVEISCDVRSSFSSTWLINAESTDIVEYCQDNPPWSSESIPLTYTNQRFLDYNIISIIEKK